MAGLFKNGVIGKPMPFTQSSAQQQGTILKQKLNQTTDAAQFVQRFNIAQENTPAIQLSNDRKPQGLNQK